MQYFRILFSFFGPWPRIDYKSFTLLNFPCDFRAYRIFPAAAGPMPGTC